MIIKFKDREGKAIDTSILYKSEEHGIIDIRIYREKGVWMAKPKKWSVVELSKVHMFLIPHDS